MTVKADNMKLLFVQRLTLVERLIRKEGNVFREADEIKTGEEEGKSISAHNHTLDT